MEEVESRVYEGDVEIWCGERERLERRRRKEDDGVGGGGGGGEVFTYS